MEIQDAADELAELQRWKRAGIYLEDEKDQALVTVNEMASRFTGVKTKSTELWAEILKRILSTTVRRAV